MATQQLMPLDRGAWLKVLACRHHRASISTSDSSEQRAPGRVMQSGPRNGGGIKAPQTQITRPLRPWSEA